MDDTIKWGDKVHINKPPDTSAETIRILYERLSEVSKSLQEAQLDLLYIAKHHPGLVIDAEANRKGKERMGV